MKTFRWEWVTPVGYVIDTPLLWLSERDGDFGKVWGAVRKIQEHEYQVIILNKERNTHQTVEDVITTVKDAKDAIEKKLFDDGVISDGDAIDDYTES